MKRALLIGIVSVFFLVSGTAAYLWHNFLNNPASDSQTEVIFEVMPGKSFSSVAKELESQGVIENAGLFSLFARIRGSASKMKAGEYMFRPSMRPSEVLDILNSGKSIGHNFTITEGLNIYEIAKLVAGTKIATEEEFLKTVQDPTLIQNLLGQPLSSLEGYLFPETYQVTKFTDLPGLLKIMTQRSLHAYSLVEARARTLNLTRHQVMTLASIIEKETGAPIERPMISSVFHNRMDQGMMLQTDPTVLYAKMLRSNRYEISITRADLQLDDDYNTYRRKGLPPGPIANAGAEAINAAVNPAVSEYLFFVSQNNGTHIFTKDYKDHQAAVTKFQMNPRAREGKSWRDLNSPAASGPAEKPSPPVQRR